MFFARARAAGISHHVLVAPRRVLVARHASRARRALLPLLGDSSLELPFVLRMINVMMIDLVFADLHILIKELFLFVAGLYFTRHTKYMHLLHFII